MAPSDPPADPPSEPVVAGARTAARADVRGEGGGAARLQHPGAGRGLEVGRLPHQRTACLRRDRLSARPMVGHDLDRRRGNCWRNGAVALPDLVQVRFSLNSADAEDGGRGPSEFGGRAVVPDPALDPSALQRPARTKESPVSILAAAVPADYEAPGVADFWQPLIGSGSTGDHPRVLRRGHLGRAHHLVPAGRRRRRRRSSRARDRWPPRRSTAWSATASPAT